MIKTIITVWLIKNHERVMRDVILPEFKRNNPDIEVLLTTTTWEYLWDQVGRYYKRNQGPDVFQIGNTLNGLLAEMGAIKDITALAKKGGGLSPFVREARGLCVAPGSDSIHSIPWYLDVRLLCYRHDILKALSIDTEELKTIKGLAGICQKVHDQELNDKKIAAVGVFGQKDAMLLHNLAPWLWNYGGDFLSADNKEVKFNTDQSLQGMRTYFGLVNEFCHHETVLQSPDQLMENFMVQGDYCFANVAPAVYEKYLDPQKPISKITKNVSYTIMPAGTAGRQTFLGGSNLAISSFSRHPEEAWRFISFMTQEETQKQFFLYSQQPPSLTKCYTPTFLMDSPFDRALKEAVASGRCFPNIEKWALIEDILIETIHRILAAVKENLYTENLLSEQVKEAAGKVRVLLEAG